MQGTPGDDVFYLPPNDEISETLDGAGGIDLLTFFVPFDTSVTLDLSNPAVPQTIHWPQGYATTIVNIERIDLEGPYAEEPLHVTAGAYSDTLMGGARSDYLDGGAGADTIDGGSDSLWNNAADTLIGGAGNDVFSTLGTDEGHSNYTGGPGRDLFIMGEYDAFYRGRYQYNDTILDFTGGSSGDILQWSDAYEQDYWAGRLRVVQSGGDVLVQEFLDAPPPDSFAQYFDYEWNTLVTLRGVTLSELTRANFSQAVELWGARDDTLRGTEGPDSLNGGFGNDDILGRGGNDTLNGGQGNDTLNGADGNDTINGGYGDDTIFGGAGADRINAGYENDKVFGDAGNDRIDGEQGNDTLMGGAGDDRIDGGSGNDRIYGDSGNDTLVSGPGNDTLRGDMGDDVFTITGSYRGNLDEDVILDFVPGEDRIDLRSVGFDSWSEIAPRIENNSAGYATLLLWNEDDYFGSAERVTLIGVSAAELSAQDFVLG